MRWKEGEGRRRQREGGAGAQAHHDRFRLRIGEVLHLLELQTGKREEDPVSFLGDGGEREKRAERTAATGLASSSD